MPTTIINVLMLLMQIAGPTTVAGIPGGTTAAFLSQTHATAQHSAARRK